MTEITDYDPENWREKFINVSSVTEIKDNGLRQETSTDLGKF